MNTPEAKTTMTAEQLQREFSRRTGDVLEIKPFEESLEGVIPRVDYLSFNRLEVTADDTEEIGPASSHLRKKYGDFLIAVYETDVPPKPDIPTETIDGVDWRSLVSELGPEFGPYVAAEKAYGRNVQLRWYPASRQRKTNSQWERLDAILSAILE